MIHWIVSQSHDHAGFHLWRQEFEREQICLSQSLLVGANINAFADPSPPRGPAEYWLQELTTDGSENWYGPAILEAAVVPASLHMVQNQPNPFNPDTTISFELPRPGVASLAVYDLRGQLVKSLWDGALAAGHHEVEWDGRDEQGDAAASGVYMVRLLTDDGAACVQKMTLAR